MESVMQVRVGKRLAYDLQQMLAGRVFPDAKGVIAELEENGCAVWLVLGDADDAKMVYLEVSRGTEHQAIFFTIDADGVWLSDVVGVRYFEREGDEFKAYDLEGKK